MKAQRPALHEMETKLRESVAAKDVDTALTYFADDVIILLPNAPTIDGKAALSAYMANALSNPGFDINTQVKKSEIAQGGDLGYTLVSYEVTTVDAAGNRVAEQGDLVRIWKKGADGNWKVVVEIVNSASPTDTRPRSR